MEFLGFIITVLIFLIFIIIYMLYVTRGHEIPKSNKKSVDLSLVHEGWQGVELMMKEGGPVNYRQAIMEADKLVDAVLRSRVEGTTMGERLKASKRFFTQHTYDQLWTAHKIRNKVAHEADFEGLSSDARLAVRNFEKALTELRVI
jgi:hypothetical protein